MPYKDKERERQKQRERIAKLRSTPEGMDKLRAIWRRGNVKRKAKKPAYNRQRRAKLRSKAYDILGWDCSCCGDRLDELFTIDHVNNDGNVERKGFSNSAQIYEKVIASENPKNRYQTLCRGCNWSKHRGNGICIHKRNNPFSHPAFPYSSTLGGFC